ncbi:hypothetical protein HCK01_13435 [Streptomyces sp. AA8]|uniref:hypothetical protein n=1 Tax=Streptomyces telluris TaxID=2720021 RepID=UPI00143C49CD|nr:hypothetical protein [Streptomyces telluris]NJP78309.1 hypothetical protein [Streptomyces telluris]
MKLQGREQVSRIDPAAFGCSRLAAELADEWVEYVAATNVTFGPAGAYKRAIDRFCKAVDTALKGTGTLHTLHLGHPELARLRPGPEPGHARLPPRPERHQEEPRAAS